MYRVIVIDKGGYFFYLVNLVFDKVVVVVGNGGYICV